MLKSLERRVQEGKMTLEHARQIDQDLKRARNPHRCTYKPYGGDEIRFNHSKQPKMRPVRHPEGTVFIRCELECLESEEHCLAYIQHYGGRCQCGLAEYDLFELPYSAYQCCLFSNVPHGIPK